MKNHILTLGALVLALASCSVEPASNDRNGLATAGMLAAGMTAAGIGGAAGIAPITGGTGGVGGVAAPTGGAGASTGGSIAGVGGSQTGGVGAAGVAGAMTGGISGGDAGVDPGPQMPIIPEISGECPEFQPGTNTVSLMGVRGTVIAGTKTEGTGPLLFYFYGTGRAGGVNSLPQTIKDDIVSLGGIVFAPQSALNTGGDCSGTRTFGIDDFKVSDQIVACAVKNYGIDPRRIYATGCSAGGLTTGCMGIMRSNYMAAVAPNSGGVTIGYGPLQNPNHMPNAITMNGGAADNVLVNFGNTSEAYDNYVLKYGGFAVNCIHGGGHCGAPRAVYEAAWKFMKDHPFGVTPLPYAGGLPSGTPTECKIFEMTDMEPLGGY